ncbi:MAG TPA: hypothetical protein VL026_07900 [Rhizomicrobium sp.]|nr:hypothetical protein [Rhizomicrobium sp.]
MTSTFRESQEMLARVNRSESETENAARRIEDHLRSLARRLDSSEQSKTGSSRVLNDAANEANQQPQDNSQIFGTLGTHVISLGERLDRLEERASANTVGGASVRGLQDGLTRMADQMADTAKQSASQISVLATAMEAVVTKMSEAHEQAASGVSALGSRIGHIDERIGALETTLHVKDEATERALQRLEQRSSHYDEIVEQLLAGVEERHAAIRDEFKHSLQALDSRYGMRRQELEQAIATTKDAQAQAHNEVHARIGRLEDHFAADRDDASKNGITAEQLQRLEETIERLAARVDAHEEQAVSTLARLDDAAARPEQADAHEVGSRVYGIEQSLQDLMDRLEEAERRSTASTANLDEQLRALGGRIEGFDRDTREAISELHLSLHHTAGRLELIENSPPAPAVTAQAEETLFAEHLADDAPAQPVTVEAIADDYADDLIEVSADDDAGTQNTLHDDAPAGDDVVTPAFPDSAIHRAFGQRPAGDFVSVTAQDEDLFRDERPLAADGFAAHAAQNDFLGARRSAMAASAAVDAEPMATTLGGFTWGARREVQPVQEEQPRSRVLVIGGVALVAILAIGAGVMLSQQMGSHERVATAPAAHPASVAAVASRATKPAPAPKLPAADAKPATPEKLAAQAPAAPLPKVMATGDRLTTLANGGNVKAQLLVGLKFLDGDGVKTNEAEASKWLQRAADQGEAIAQYRLGTLYERGHGVATNAAKAVQLYSAAAHQGNRKAMHNLAVAYAEGAGTQKNYAEAARWFGRAAALGLADSQFNLAVLYERGLGVPQSLSQAYKWYAVAATQGDTESKARIVALSSQLSPADLDVAQRAAISFKPEPLNRAANVTPETPGRG